MSEARPPAIEIRDLTVRAGTRTLLDRVALTIAPGEVVLLAGPSGAGKSVLLRLLSGLTTADTPGFRISGSLKVAGREILGDPAAARGAVGLVFQDFALFTGLTAADNVAFATDHRQPPLERPAAKELRDGLLAELGIPGEARVGELSGGQRQRVAIARALAFSPSIIAYDEPTSGLDPAMRDTVAERIRETSRDHGTTTLVVTHDLAGLLPIADRVLLLDPQARSLLEVPAGEAHGMLAGFVVPVARPAKAVGAVKRSGRTVLRFFEATGSVMEGVARAVCGLVPRWPSARWGLRFLGHYLKTVAGPGALLYFLLAGAVIGLVSAYFTFTFLPKREYTEALILDDLIGGLGFGLHRILVPLIMTLLLAARAGAAVSADISTRVAGRQTDAMRSFGVPPSRYLMTGTLLAFLIGTPLLAVLSYFGAQVASAAVFAVMAPDLSIHAFDAMYHRLLLGPGDLLPAGTGWVAAKDLTAAFGIAAISYFAGAKDKTSPEDVARSITHTVIWATFLVLTVHLVFALVEF